MVKYTIMSLFPGKHIQKYSKNILKVDPNCPFWPYRKLSPDIVKSNYVMKNDVIVRVTRSENASSASSRRTCSHWSLETFAFGSVAVASSRSARL